MRWVLSPPFSTGFHHVIFRTGGSAATRLSCLGVGRSPKTEPPSIHLVALRGSKIRRTCGSREGVTGASERMRAEFSSPEGGSR